MKRTIAAAVVALTCAVAVQAQTPANQPSGRDIFLKALHATGADTILPKHTSLKTTGTLSVPSQGVTAPMETQRSSKGAFHVVITVEGFGTFEQGYADSTAWSNNPQQGASILSGAAALSSRRQSMWLETPEIYSTITNEGLVKFQNQDAWKLTMVTKDGLKLTRYFDPTTGYAVGLSVTQDAGMGEQEIVTTMSDYKDFGGIKYPSKQVQMIGDIEQDVTIDKIEFDTVPATAFELPAAIKAIKK